MSYGGVNNIFLFNQGKSRPAKDALFKLGGILTSSEELMQAAAPIVNSAINATTPPMTPPMTPPSVVQESLMPSLLGNNPSNEQIANKLNPKPPRPPVKKLSTGGLTLLEQLSNPNFAAVTQMNQQKKKKTPDLASNPQEFLMEVFNRGDEKLKKSILSLFGSPAAAAATFEAKINSVKKASGNPDELMKTINSMVGLPNSKESLEKIYQYVTTNKAPSKISSNELVKMIMQSAQATALADPGSRAERFGKATLLGLNTALALKTGGGRKGGKTIDPYENAVIRIAEKLITRGEPEDEAFRIAKQQVAELYGLTPPSPSPSPNDDSDSKKSKTNVDDLIDKYTK